MSNSESVLPDLELSISSLSAGEKFAAGPFDIKYRLMGVPLVGAIEMQNKKIPQKLIPWLEAKKRHRLSDMHVQMARELGMNSKKLGKLDNHNRSRGNFRSLSSSRNVISERSSALGPRKSHR